MKQISFVILIIILGLLVSCSPNFSKFKTIDNAANEWKMFRNSLNGYYQEGVYGSDIKALAWESRMRAKSYSSPVATGSYVAVSALDEYLYFFDVKNGERINAYKLGAPGSESPFISNKIIYDIAGAFFEGPLV